jgi:hypothetical protein
MDLLLSYVISFFSFLYNCKYFYRTWLYVRNTAVVLSEAATAYTSRAHEFTPTFLVGSVLLISLVLLCCPIMCLSSALRCPLRFQHKTMFGSFYPPVICRREHVLFTLYVFVCVSWCPTHVVLCAFVLLVVVLCFLYYNPTTLIDRLSPFVICGCAVHSVGWFLRTVISTWYNIQVVVVKRPFWTYATCFYRHELQILELFAFWRSATCHINASWPIKCRTMVFIDSWIENRSYSRQWNWWRVSGLV